MLATVRLRALPGVRHPLSDERAEKVDLVVIRENSEGEYFNCGAVFKPGQVEEVALQTALHSRVGVERILRYAFELAKTRKQRLTMATKSNVLKHAMVLWDRVFTEVKQGYPEVEADKWHVDALCLNLVLRPWDYDVIVGSNLFADILSDLIGGILGGLGLMPGANINPGKKHPSLFEPIHGSAPDIAGKGIANPIAAVRSAALMLDFLGEPLAASIIEKGVDTLLANRDLLTPDLGGTHNCEQVGDAIASIIACIRP